MVPVLFERPTDSINNPVQKWVQKWKSEDTPMVEEFLKKLLDIAELDTLSEALREQPRDYAKQSWNFIFGPRARSKLRVKWFMWCFFQCFLEIWEIRDLNEVGISVLKREDGGFLFLFLFNFFRFSILYSVVVCGCTCSNKTIIQKKFIAILLKE